jgi:type I restriction enzyme, R subunit
MDTPAEPRVPQPVRSQNFGFMRVYDPQFERLGALAERYFADDLNTCLIKLRQFAELLAQETAARIGLYTSREENQNDPLRRLTAERAVPPPATDLIHQIGIPGNKATHSPRARHLVS